MKLVTMVSLVCASGMFLVPAALATGGQYYEGGYYEAQDDPCAGKGGVDGPPVEGTTILRDGRYWHLLTWTCRNGEIVDQWVDITQNSEYVPDSSNDPPAQNVPLWQELGYESECEWQSEGSPTE